MCMKCEYCAVIRTLGTAGDKYYQTLLSLKNQTIPPKKILVYIAEGYSLLKETIGIEQYIYVKKGMIAQRALSYKEVDTDYILFLDDDLSFSPNTVERLFAGLDEKHGDVISVNIFPNHELSFIRKVYGTIVCGTFPMISSKYAFKVRKNGCYSYNNNPKNGIYLSQSAAGSLSLYKFSSYKAIHFEDEIYFDKFRYPLGEDQLMFNKAYVNGQKVLIDYSVNVNHLDGGSGHVKQAKEKLIDNVAISYLIWYRTCFQVYGLKCIPAYVRKITALALASALLQMLGMEGNILYYCKGLVKGFNMSKSEDFKSLPPFKL